jgi:chromosomal replication initiator protein
MDYKKLWESALSEIEMNVSAANFSTWFKDTSIAKSENGVVFLGVPNAFVKEWLSNKHHNFILKVLRGLADEVRSLEYLITKSSTKKNEVAKEERGQQATKELPLNDFYVNKEDNLNPRYTFDSFVIGPFNELAYAASQAVIKKPGIVYNPLFIYGSTGHGKTHLIQAIGNYLKTLYPEKRVHYVTSEKFTMDYITSVTLNKVNNFKEKYRKYDVLIMDDIQFLSNKEKTQEELFHLFNNVFDNNRQIVFSSDKHPNFIPNLEERLKSRFNAGMIVDIPAPDYESRLAILKAKQASHNLHLSPETLDFVATNITSNIRELEGALNTISCQHQLKGGKDLSLSEVKTLLRNNSQPKRIISPKEVIKMVAGFYNIEEDSIYKKTRKKEVIKPRQVVMYILREEFNISYPSIGEKMGGRDHTTVIHSYEKIKRELKNDSALIEEINQIKSMIV